MATVTFRAKVEVIYNFDNTEAYRLVKVPEMKRSHCDMAAFRRHPKFGPYANSDLFANLLRKQRRDHGIGEHLRLDRLPPCVTVDTSGFLAKVTIDFAQPR